MEAQERFYADYIAKLKGQLAAKRARKNASQRNRRAKHRRIDYYVSAAALAIINAQCKPGVGYDTSSVINRLIESAGQTTVRELIEES